jgi:hypothetical protein
MGWPTARRLRRLLRLLRLVTARLYPGKPSDAHSDPDQATGDQRYPEASAPLIRAPSVKIGYLFGRPRRVPIAPCPCMHDRRALGAAKLAALHRPREQFLHSAIASATDRTGENHDGRHLSLTVPCKLARASLAGCQRQTAPASRAICRGRQPITVFPPDSLGGLSGGRDSTRGGASGSKDKAEGHLSRRTGTPTLGHDQPRCRDFCRLLGSRHGFDAGGHVLRRGLDFASDHPKHAAQPISNIEVLGGFLLPPRSACSAGTEASRQLSHGGP